MSDIVQRDTISIPAVTVTVTSVLSSVLTAFITSPGTSTGPGASAVECGIDLMKFDRKTFQLINIGANALTQASLEATSVPAEQRASTDWEVIESTQLANLAAGATKSWQIFNDTRRFWRVRCASASGTTIKAVMTAGGGS